MFMQTYDAYVTPASTWGARRSAPKTARCG